MKRALLVMMLFGACDKDDPETTSEADTDTDTDTSAFTVSVTDARYECEGYDTGAEPTLAVTAGKSSGTATVKHLQVQTGCCPTLDITALADPSTSEVFVSYNLDKDPCDCICTIDLFYTLGNLPAGSWLVDANDLETMVVVP